MQSTDPYAATQGFISHPPQKLAYRYSGGSFLSQTSPQSSPVVNLNSPSPQRTMSVFSSVRYHGIPKESDFSGYKTFANAKPNYVNDPLMVSYRTPQFYNRMAMNRGVPNRAIAVRGVPNDARGVAPNKAFSARPLAAGAEKSLGEMVEWRSDGGEFVSGCVVGGAGYSRLPRETVGSNKKSLSDELRLMDLKMFGRSGGSTGFLFLTFLLHFYQEPIFSFFEFLFFSII